MSGPLGVVLLGSEAAADHERAVQQLLGEKLGRVLGCSYLGPYDRARHDAGHYYFVPYETLTGDVSPLGIRGPQDLYGGVVGYPFIATKAISHGLYPGAQPPPGWSTAFVAEAGQVVLQGYTVFALEDARQAGRHLLERGPIRLKPVHGRGGRDQAVAHDPAQLDALLQQQDERATRQHGLVLEENLLAPRTYSVGQVTVAGITLSYYGTQQLTRDNDGAQVYGGSQLSIVRGDYLELLSLPLQPQIRLAIQQARLYELAAFAAYPSLFASRRNYDVACGEDAQGRSRCAVLEQSWRLGGASAAEVFALEALQAAPSLQRLAASTHEVYGDAPAPAEATCLYRGKEAGLGLLSLYVKVDTHERT